MSNRPLGNFLLRTMVMVMLVPIILGMVPLSLFPTSATPTAPTTNNTSDAPALISSLYERVERSVVQISPQFSEFDIFRTPLPTENTA